MEMICLMHEADPRGSLLLNGKAVSPKQLSNLCGVTLKEVKPLLEELRNAGVFSEEEDGLIFSRRLRRETKKSETNTENGLRGGNPKLKNSDNQNAPVSDNRKPKSRITAPDNRETNPYSARAIATHIPEARIQNTKQLSNCNPPRELDRIEAALREAAGLEESPAPMLADLSPILGFMDGGVSLEETILPVLRAKRGRCDKARSWDYFSDAIRESFDKRSASAASAPQPPAPGEEPVRYYGSQEMRRDRLLDAISRFNKNPDNWLEFAWGPPPPENPFLVKFAAENGISLREIDPNRQR